ncbi:MAG: MBL fold metallo-hydrolase [Candidatus Methanomethylicia archaeon]
MQANIQVKRIRNVGIYASISYGLSSNIYIIKSSDENAIVDVGYGPPHSNIMETLNEFGMEIEDIDKILITHRHKDHTRELRRIIESNERAKIYIHKEDKEIVMENLKIGRDRIHTLYGDEEIGIGDIKMKVIHTPGHTSGSVCYKYEETIFTGDLVFANGDYGRTDLPTGNPRELMKSLEMVATLNIETMLPGHGEVILKQAKDHIKLAVKNAIANLRKQYK